ncbi:MAG: carbon-nitrogen hydrolase family protein [Firmicutes bacterium]|nr:carbon-nitrogen hydrolase family protein [Bacillota bacterium]
MNTIQLAMIQLENNFKDQAAGYAQAEALISQAAAQGAEFAVLPELSGCGYIPNQTVWQYAEPRDGKTAQWASELSARLGIYIGAGFVEKDGADYYNSYLLSGPQGEICGMVRKEDAESYCFKRDRGGTHIDTALGRIGIGICADNHYIDRLRRMKEADIDLMLMPHANPTPYRTNRRITQDDLELLAGHPATIATAYSNYLRVPAVYVNAVGGFPEFSGGLGAKSFNEDCRLLGGSLVADATGNVVEKMGGAVSFRVVTVTLGKTAAPPVEPAVYHGKWLHQGNALFRYFILPHMTRKGVRSYNKAIGRAR